MPGLCQPLGDKGEQHPPFRKGGEPAGSQGSCAFTGEKTGAQGRARPMPAARGKCGQGQPSPEGLE